MPASDFVTDICIASADEAARFSRFVQGFLSANGFPFVMIHNLLEATGEGRRVVFEDPGVGAKFASEWGELV